MGFDLIAGAQVVYPAVNKALFASLKKGKKGQGERPTDDPGYKETLELMRKLLHFCALSTIEDLHSITTAWVPPPPSCVYTEVEVPDYYNDLAASHIQANLSEENLNRVGKTWWQWRKLGSVVRAQWVEMRHDMLERKQRGDPGSKVIFYIHGGGYHLGGLGHGPQIQRHARKLKGRVFAPTYRLAPEFPFPCGLQDVLSAYLYLLTIQDANHIVLAGDSAGGGLCLALLIILRDQGLPMPAGASLISPWADLTHSFPSITIPTEFDYVPAFGFHAKPSLAWPPPTPDQMKALGMPEPGDGEPPFEVMVDGEVLPLVEQFQMYAPNLQLQIPLVSPVCAASLGGFCPVQIISGGGEVLRDEQMYLAHKMADPESYAPCEEILERNSQTMKDVGKYPPTDVQLLSFDHGAHAQPTIGHTNIAKYQYRSVAQFAAWALAKAQRVDIEIDDTGSDYDSDFMDTGVDSSDVRAGVVGKAGDPLPQFVDHMIRHRVDRNGRLFPLAAPADLRCCNVPRDQIGIPKEAALKGWLEYRSHADAKYASLHKKLYEQRKRQVQIGYVPLSNGEVAPPTALAGRRVKGAPEPVEKPRGKLGKSVIGMIFGKLEAPSPKKVGTEVKTNNRKSRMVSYMDLS